MKRAYTKPVIQYEDFSLSTSIAVGCDNIVSTQSENLCGIIFGSMTIFSDGITGCYDEVTPGDGIYDKFCYHVPMDGSELFNS